MALDIVKARGVFLYDRQGKDYLDFISGISVSNLGHGSVEVIRAVKRQAEQYLHLNVYGEFVQTPQVRLAEKLVGLLPDCLDSVYFVNSGSEAVEGALKLAKRYTGRTEIICFRNAYHGSSHGALSVMGNERFKQAFRPLLPDIKILDFNNFCQLDQISGRTACVITETVQSEAGVVLPADGYLQQLSRRCRETGALLVIDDVQWGMGRTGSLFSFEPTGIVPDILVLAKALGAGMPLGAFVASRSIMESLAHDPELGHITTFGGHPVSCAAALAGLEQLLQGGYIQEADHKGAILEEALKDHPAVACIRRKGLSLGVDLRDPSATGTFLRHALACGVIIDYFLFSPTTFRIAPPLVISQGNIREGIRRIHAALTLL